VNVGDLIASYGYWAVFLLVAAESLGIPPFDRHGAKVVFFGRFVSVLRTCGGADVAWSVIVG
jgi:membrane protein DedA with SNARE-associated domain